MKVKYILFYFVLVKRERECLIKGCQEGKTDRLTTISFDSVCPLGRLSQRGESGNEVYLAAQLKQAFLELQLVGHD